MSYDCDLFKIKKIENFKIPIASLCKSKQSDWIIDYVDKDKGTVVINDCTTIMSGIIENGIFICKSIDCSGESSGFIMAEILEPAFRDSTGELIASCIWEGGDTINQLIVKDGSVKWEDIEI